MSRRLAAATLLLTLGGCRTLGTQITFNEDADVRILFIGNSLTYVNDVPGLVQGIAVRAGLSVATLSIAAPDFSLEDHWNRGAPAEIRRLRPDVVVLQQGPSSLQSSRAHLILWTGRYATVIREVGGEPALYMVWPDASRIFAFPDVEQSYAEAAAAVQGKLLPAGTTWLEGWKLDESLPFHGPDNFHPSYYGSVAAALTIYAALFDVAPEDLPTAHPQVPEAMMALLRSAVAASVERWSEQDPATVVPGPAQRGPRLTSLRPRPAAP